VGGRQVDFHGSGVMPLLPQQKADCASTFRAQRKLTPLDVRASKGKVLHDLR
jgi:hypothetical protein